MTDIESVIWKNPMSNYVYLCVNHELCDFDDHTSIVYYEMPLYFSIANVDSLVDFVQRALTNRVCIRENIKCVTLQFEDHHVQGAKSVQDLIIRARKAIQRRENEFSDVIRENTKNEWSVLTPPPQVNSNQNS